MGAMSTSIQNGMKDQGWFGKKSFMIGDQISDMKFAKKSKIKGYLFKKKNLFNFVKEIFKIKN